MPFSDYKVLQWRILGGFHRFPLKPPFAVALAMNIITFRPHTCNKSSPLWIATVQSNWLYSCHPAVVISQCFCWLNCAKTAMKVLWKWMYPPASGGLCPPDPLLCVFGNPLINFLDPPLYCSRVLEAYRNRQDCRYRRPAVGLSSVRRLSIRRLAIRRLFLCFNYL